MSLFKLNNISALQIFQIFRYTSIILTSIILSKSCLSTTQIGYYETLLFLTSLVCFFWINSIIQAFLSESHENVNKKIFNTYVLTIFLSFIVVVIIYLFNNSLTKIFNLPNNNYIKLLCVYIFFITPSYLVEYIFLVEKKYNSLVIIGSSTFFLQTILIFITSFTSNNFFLIILALIISAIIRFILLTYLIIKNSYFNFDHIYLNKILKLSTPLSLSALLSGSGDYIDSFLVNHFFDASTFAIFRYGAREFPITLLMATALSNAIIPELKSNNYSTEILTKLKTKSEKLIKIFFPLSITFSLVSHEIFPLIFNENFKESATIFNIYLLLITSRLLFPQSILISMQKNNVILFSSFIEILINITTSLFLMKLIGISGIAIGTIISNLSQKLFMIFYLHKYCKINVKEYTNVKKHSILSFLLIISISLVEIVLY